MIQLIPILVTLLFAILVLLWCYRSLRELKQIQHEMEEDNRQFHYFADPLVAYLETLPEGQKYDENGFRAFLEAQYGSEFKERYLANLQAQVAMVEVFRMSKERPR